MSTTYSEDSPERKTPAEVAATPVEGLDREPAAIKPAKADAKVVEPGQVENKAVTKKTARAKKKS